MKSTHIAKASTFPPRDYIHIATSLLEERELPDLTMVKEELGAFASLCMDHRYIKAFLLESLQRKIEQLERLIAGQEKSEKDTTKTGKSLSDLTNILIAIRGTPSNSAEATIEPVATAEMGLAEIHSTLSFCLERAQSILSEMGYREEKIITNLFSKALEEKHKVLVKALDAITPNPLVSALTSEAIDKLKMIFQGNPQLFCEFLNHYNNSYNKDRSDPDFLQHAADYIALPAGTEVASPEKLAILLAHPQYWNVTAKEMTYFASILVPDTLLAEASIAEADEAPYPPTAERFTPPDRIMDYLISILHPSALVTNDTLRLFIRDFYIISKKCIDTAKSEPFSSSLLEKAIKAIQAPKIPATPEKDIAKKISDTKALLCVAIEFREPSRFLRRDQESHDIAKKYSLSHAFAGATEYLLPPGVGIDPDSMCKVIEEVTVSVLGEDTKRLGYPEEWQGVYLGHLTKCCQSIGRMGEDSAKCGLQHDNCGFIVLRKGNKVLAQSLYWIDVNGGTAVVMDSFEMSGPENAKYFVPLFKAVGERLKTQGIKLLVGTGGATPYLPSAHASFLRDARYNMFYRRSDFRASDEDSLHLYESDSVGMESACIGLQCLASPEHTELLVANYLIKHPDQAGLILRYLLQYSLGEMKLWTRLFEDPGGREFEKEGAFHMAVQQYNTEYIQYIFSMNLKHCGPIDALGISGLVLNTPKGARMMTFLLKNYDFSSDDKITAFNRLIRQHTDYSLVTLFLKEAKLLPGDIIKALSIVIRGRLRPRNIEVFDKLLDLCKEPELSGGINWCNQQTWQKGWRELISLVVSSHHRYMPLTLEGIQNGNSLTHFSEEAIAILFHVIYKDSQTELFEALCLTRQPLHSIPEEFFRKLIAEGKDALLTKNIKHIVSTTDKLPFILDICDKFITNPRLDEILFYSSNRLSLLEEHDHPSNHKEIQQVRDRIELIKAKLASRSPISVALKSSLIPVTPKSSFLQKAYKGIEYLATRGHKGKKKTARLMRVIDKTGSSQTR